MIDKLKGVIIAIVFVFIISCFGVQSEATRMNTRLIRNHHAKWIVYPDKTRELEFRPVPDRIGPAVEFRSKPINEAVK